MSRTRKHKLTGAKAVSHQCENHGSCEWCRRNRTYNELRDKEKAEYDEKTYKEEQYMIDDKLSILLDKLVKTTIDFLKENGYDNADRVYFYADGLKEGMKYGFNCPSIDNSIAILDENQIKIGEYM
jgi:hypothetical protein